MGKKYSIPDYTRLLRVAKRDREEKVQELKENQKIKERKSRHHMHNRNRREKQKDKSHAPNRSYSIRDSPSYEPYMETDSSSSTSDDEDKGNSIESNDNFVIEFGSSDNILQQNETTLEKGDDDNSSYSTQIKRGSSSITRKNELSSRSQNSTASTSTASNNEKPLLKSLTPAEKLRLKLQMGLNKQIQVDEEKKLQKERKQKMEYLGGEDLDFEFTNLERKSLSRSRQTLDHYNKSDISRENSTPRSNIPEKDDIHILRLHQAIEADHVKDQGLEILKGEIDHLIEGANIHRLKVMDDSLDQFQGLDLLVQVRQVPDHQEEIPMSAKLVIPIERILVQVINFVKGQAKKLISFEVFSAKKLDKYIYFFELINLSDNSGKSKGGDGVINYDITDINKNEDPSWTSFEKLLLVQAVYKYGENWLAVTRTMKHHPLKEHPKEFFTTKACTDKFKLLIEPLQLDLEDAHRMSATAKLAKQLYQDHEQQPSPNKDAGAIIDNEKTKIDNNNNNDNHITVSTSNTNSTNYINNINNNNIQKVKDNIDNIKDGDENNIINIVDNNNDDYDDNNVNDDNVESKHDLHKDVTKLLGKININDDKDMEKMEIDTNIDANNIANNNPANTNIPININNNNKDDSNDDDVQMTIELKQGEHSDKVSGSNGGDSGGDVNYGEKMDIDDNNNNGRKVTTTSNVKKHESSSNVSDQTTEIVTPSQIEYNESSLVPALGLVAATPTGEVSSTPAGASTSTPGAASISTPDVIKTPHSNSSEVAPGDMFENTNDDNKKLKKWLKLVSMILHEISNHRCASLFQNPIREQDAPGYNEIVNHPTDLKTLKRRLRDGEITNTDQFHRELMLMFMNAAIYNREDTDVYRMTTMMKDHVEDQILEFRQTEDSRGVIHEPATRRKSMASDGRSRQ
nr:13538_t:CDS:10 [Entrophospora candida]